MDAVLDDTFDKLMPGMTVSCEIIVNRLADTLFVPIESVFNKQQTEIVYVKQGNNYKLRQVVTGEENENYVLILKGLESGETIAMIDPEQIKGTDDAR